MKSSAVIALLLILLIASPSRSQPIPVNQRDFFETHIRPLLIEHCYECHNTNDTAEAGLALDWRDPLLSGGENGSVISKSDPSNSLLLRVIRHEVDDAKMPENGPKLPDDVVADFEKWIRMGAPDPRDSPPSGEELANATSWDSTRERRRQWWSFQPITNPAPPSQPTSWGTADVQHDVDRFILAKLEQAGLTPAVPADRTPLIRRTYFALTGLPPSPQEIDNFLSDDATGAYERLVDRLLASPAFGERWARHWMDWVRYAESHGSEGDPAIVNAWQYRDYLIRALNADVPYDQLLREHVAGDLLDPPRINHTLGLNESLIGTAHWRMVFHGFAPTDALDERVRFTDDQIDTFSKAFLGLTVSCARCHNHKFDAISQEDYYALFGILGSTRPGRSAMEAPEVQARNFDRLAERKPQIRAQLAADWLAEIDQLSGLLLDTSTSQSAEDPSSLLHLWHLLGKEAPLDADAFKSWWNEQRSAWKSAQTPTNRDVIRQWNLSDSNATDWYANGIGVRSVPVAAGDFRLQPEGDLAIEAILPAGIHSGTLSSKHPARLASPDFELGENEELWLRVNGGGDAMSRFVVQNYPRDGTVFPVTHFSDKENNWRWHRYDLSYWSGDSVHIELTAARDAPLLAKPNERSWFSIRDAFIIRKGDAKPSENQRESLAGIFESPIAAPTSRESLADHYRDAIESAIVAWRDERASDQHALLLHQAVQDGLLNNRLDSFASAAPLLQEYRRLEQDVPVTIRVPTLTEWEARDRPLFVRGDHKQPADTVPRRFLEAIDATPYATADSGRLQLAADMLRSDNPFTRRVIVNRVWHHLFGKGLVETPDNFGRLGSVPSHPELLDYLAHRFATVDGWQFKPLIRFLLTSQTWQQSSQPHSDSIVLAGERDATNRLWSHASVRRLEAEVVRDALLATDGRLNRDLYGAPVKGSENRRSVYVPVIRNNLDAFLSAFDAPVPFRTTGRRDTTNVPAQSLMMMNDPFVIESARRFAGDILDDDRLTTNDERVAAMWRRGLGREPSAGELRAATALIDQLRTTYEATNSPPSVEHSLPEQAWIDLAHSIYNLKEFIYVR